MSKEEKDIYLFEDIGRDDVGLVGGKGANLGEMYKSGFPVPGGFVVSASAYFHFLEKTSLNKKIAHTLKGLDVEDSKGLQEASKKVKTAILGAKMPDELKQKIADAYVKISGNENASVAVRSSATAEDLPEASFAGQQATFLDVKGKKDLLEAVQKCWASLFESRAIFYREDQGFSHFKVGIAVPVQKMVESEVSGIMFTVHPVSNDKSQVLVEAGYGLGQPLVSGELVPDQYIVDKESKEILEKEIAHQPWQLVNNEKIKVSDDYADKQKLPDEKVVELAEIGMKIEDHYDFPQDIEWAMEGNELFIVQTRPITTIKEGVTSGGDFEVPETAVKLLEGLAASPGAAGGKVKIIKSAEELGKVKKGDILVTEMTDPDYVPGMRRAVGIITDFGGRTSHAAIVSRELGVPSVVGTDQATKTLKTGEEVTVDGTNGFVYEGNIESEIKFTGGGEEEDLDLETATNLYVNLADPQRAQEIADRNVDGVGLLRAEFMIAQIGVHPRELLARGEEEKFVQKLYEGISTFCKAFHPRPIIYRTTDFKTNEYRSLEGGEKYEDEEPNPMLGFRGAFRYITDSKVFNMELDAIKKVREEYENLNLMIPFVHTVDELKQVKKLIKRRELKQSSTFKLWMMVEIPSNVILLEDFIDVGIDGISIGSNDLTMTTLGVDRDNAKVASVYDERNPAVMWAMKKTVQTCREKGVTASICGQAPSFFPELTKKLVEWGITSISINPDVINKTRKIIYSCEQQIDTEKE